MAGKRKAIPVKTRFEIWAMPCAVCGIPYNIHCDHIVSVKRGGGSERANLQPLCAACNHIKRDSRDNAQVRSVVLARGEPHFMRAIYMFDRRYYNPFDGPCQSEWAATNPHRVAFARELQSAFVKRLGHA